jgi:hypothetical protein
MMYYDALFMGPKKPLVFVNSNHIYFVHIGTMENQKEL